MGEIDIRNHDVTTQSMKTIDYAHREIHAGSHFYWMWSDTDFDAEDLDLTIQPANSTSWMHFVFDIESTAILTVEITEDAVVNVAGTDRKTGFSAGGQSSPGIVNSNRNSSTASGVQVLRSGDTYNAGGTVIYNYTGGTATAQARLAAGTRADNEIILKQNSIYRIKITGGTADARLGVKFTWYEHTDKTW